MQRTSELIGKTVVSADRGERVGTVADVLVEPELGRVAGFVVQSGFMRGERVLPYDAVQVLGRDAVVARSQQAILDPAGWEQRHIAAVRSSRLQKRRVITRSGREVGSISDVYLDEQSGGLEAYEIATPGFLVHHRARLPFSKELTVGSDAVVVPDAVGDAIDEQRG